MPAFSLSPRACSAAEATLQLKPGKQGEGKVCLSGRDLGITAAQVQLWDLIRKINSFVVALSLSEPDANGKIGTVCAGEATFCRLVQSF